MPFLRIIRRPDTGALTIVGTVAGRRVRSRAQSDDIRLAREEAAALETRLLREDWHGERRGVRTLAQAMIVYVETNAPNQATRKLLERIARALGHDLPLGEINQEKLNKARRLMLDPAAAPATVVRNLIVPLRAVLLHAAQLGWCDSPRFKIPRQPQGRTNFLLPDEVARLIAAAAPHLRPLIELLVGTGARMSEALELEWRDVDLEGARIIFWRTKNGKRRIVPLSGRLVAVLANLPHRDGAVFLTPRGTPYRNTDRMGGGQIGGTFKATLARAGLDTTLTPHDLRHTWASWHYAIHRDPLLLKEAGQWSSVALVERYAHLLPAGQEAAIRDWHGGGTAAPRKLATA